MIEDQYVYRITQAKILKWNSIVTLKKFFLNEKLNIVEIQLVYKQLIFSLYRILLLISATEDKNIIMTK